MLFTAINSRQILQNRYLTVAFAMTEGTGTTPDNFAYANIDLEQLKPMTDTALKSTSTVSKYNDWDYCLVEPKAKLISRNNHIGTVQISLLYRVKNQSKLDPEEM